MEESSILKTYFELKKNNGKVFLPENDRDIYSHVEKVLPVKKVLDRRCDTEKLIGYDNKIFYVKRCPQRGFEAELLFSRIFTKAGLESATYYPLFSKNKFENYVMSNNVLTAKSDVAANVSYILFNDYLTYFPQSINNFNGISRYYSEEALKDIIKTQVMDVASLNSDRHKYNYGFSLEDGVSQNIKLFDFAGVNYYSSFSYFVRPFYDLITSKDLSTGEDILENLKTNETVSEFVKPKEMAEMVGSFNIKKEANEIENEFDFKFSKSFIEETSFMYDKTAEILLAP